MILISRAHQYSPNSIDKDEAILHEVGKRLEARHCEIHYLTEEEASQQLPAAHVYVTMGRSEALLDKLQRQQEKGALVINRTEGIQKASRRYWQMQYLEQQGVTVAPHEGNAGYWVKRGDASAQTKADVVFAPDREKAEALAEAMKRDGATAVDLRAHVEGDLVKFYGVRDSGFFRCFYPGDDGISKFGDESRNGTPHHYAYDQDKLTEMAERAATLLEIDVYGGDCIIQPDGTPVLIDFNDWPSFSRCRDEAAEAIAGHILQRIQQS